MIIVPFDERLKKLQTLNPRDENIEGILLYKNRIFSLAEKELLDIARNPWATMSNRCEVLCQILEYCRVKSY